MRHSQLPRNANLALRHQQQIAREEADARLRASKDRRPEPRAEIAAALDRGEVIGPISEYIVDAREFSSKLHGLPSHAVAGMRRLLETLAQRSDVLEDDRMRDKALNACRELAHDQPLWIRDPEGWRPRAYNARRQLVGFVRHMVCKYAVPAFFDSAWTDDALIHREWFIHVAQGGNLRTAPDMPIELTKAMAHAAMHAPSDLSIDHAIRYGQARTLGVGDRHARAMLGTILGNIGFFGQDGEAFWTTFLRWLAQHPMLDPAQIGPIVDYLYNQRFGHARYDPVNRVVVANPPQPNLTLSKRSPDALCAQVERWHRTLRDTHAAEASGEDRLSWGPSGIMGYRRVEGEGRSRRRFEAIELRSSGELRAEGAAMGHCVATYARTCHAGASAIFSLRVEDAEGQRRLLTVEVNVRTRQIVQARGKHNAMPTQSDERLLRGWSTTAGLAVGQHAWVRR